ncbi:MAG: hypothetical protein H6575_08335 [Lewinellaceae bacterium]|nr:hypothetical protein [Lewinellaceae bacterium]
MDSNEDIKRIEDLIANGDTEDAILALVEFTKNSSSAHYEDAVLLSGQFRQWKRENMLGVQQSGNELRRIEMGILSILKSDSKQGQGQKHHAAPVSSTHTSMEASTSRQSSGERHTGSSGNNNAIYIIGGILLLLAAGVIAWLVMGKNDQQANQPTIIVVPQNFVNPPSPRDLTADQQVFVAKWYLEHYPEISKSGYTGETGARLHFMKVGINDGRQSSPTFNVQYYKTNNPDLEQVYGNDYLKYYQHYVLFGQKENRPAVDPNQQATIEAAPATNTNQTSESGQQAATQTDQGNTSEPPKSEPKAVTTPQRSAETPTGPVPGSVRDKCGNTYRTVRVGNQTWMTENLLATKCDDGTPIDPGNYKTERGMTVYNTTAIEQCNICPKGWRVPSKRDIKAIDNAQAGGDPKSLFNINRDGFGGLDYLMLTDNRIWYGDFNGSNTAMTVKGDATKFSLVRCIKN